MPAELTDQEKELIIIDPQGLIVGLHHPFLFRAALPFLNGLLRFRFSPN